MTPRAESVRAAEWVPDRRDIDAIVAGKHADPFAVLGPHTAPSGVATVSVFHPEAATVTSNDINFFVEEVVLIFHSHIRIGGLHDKERL